MSILPAKLEMPLLQDHVAVALVDCPASRIPPAIGIAAAKSILQFWVLQPLAACNLCPGPMMRMLPQLRGLRCMYALAFRRKTFSKAVYNLPYKLDC